MFKVGANIKYVSHRSDHKTIKTTANTYLDITDKIEEDELNKFPYYTPRNLNLYIIGMPDMLIRKNETLVISRVSVY